MDRKEEIEKSVIEMIKETETKQRQLIDEFFEGKRSAEYTVLMLGIGIRMTFAHMLMIVSQPKFESGGVPNKDDDTPELVK